MHVGRCGWFWLWSGAGALLALSVVSFVGVFTGLPAIVALALIARRSPRWPEPLGVLAGIGILCLVVGATNLGSIGFSPAPWLVAGAALLAAGALSYGLASRSSSP
jgi:hypothetical protein